MNNLQYFEETTRDALKYQIKWNNVHTRKTPYGNREFLCFLSCIRYTFLVNIMSFSGTN